jgi:hypothetical protein
MPIAIKKNFKETHSLNDKQISSEMPVPRKMAIPPMEGVNAE